MSNAIIQHIYHTATDLNTISSPKKISSTSVCLRAAKGVFSVFPESDSSVPFEDALCGLDPVVAVKICTPAVEALLKQLPSKEESLQLDANTSIQVLETMEHLSMAQKSQRAALIRDENVLIIWEDNVDAILPLLAELDDKLIKRLWCQPKSLEKKISSAPPSQKHFSYFHLSSLFHHPQVGASGVKSTSRLDHMHRRATRSASVCLSMSPAVCLLRGILLC